MQSKHAHNRQSDSVRLLLHCPEQVILNRGSRGRDPARLSSSADCSKLDEKASPTRTPCGDAEVYKIRPTSDAREALGSTAHGSRLVAADAVRVEMSTREEIVIIRSVPGKAVNAVLSIVESMSVHLKNLGAFRNDPNTLFAEYQSGKDALSALDKISVWVDDKWPFQWGPRPTVRTNLGREAKPALSFRADQANRATCILTRPAGCRAWGAARSWREHDVDLEVTVD